MLRAVGEPGNREVQAYCPLTKKCLRPTISHSTVMTTPLTQTDYTEWSDDKSCSSNVAPILWSSGTGHPAVHAPASKQPRELRCRMESLVSSNTTMPQLVRLLRDDCPGFPFRPPHGPDHQKYDATSCMATKKFC